MSRFASSLYRRGGVLFLAGVFTLVGLTALALAQGAKKSESVVRAKVSAGKPDAEGKQVLTVTLIMDKDWHTYANPVPKDFPGEPTVVLVSKLKPEDVSIEYPKGRMVKDSTVGDYFVYDDTVDIKVTVKRPKDAGALELQVKVQACSDKQCLLPSALKLNVP
jgi:DsbC/DsbD-like thiol-disulfide interchange protein